jgi:fatty-acyl-CoA synthase
MPVNRTELTPLLFLERSMRVYATRTAAVYGRRRFNWAEVGNRVQRLASALAAAGIRRGDRVAVLAPNVPAMLEAHFGIALAGAVIVAVNTRLAPPEVAWILEHSGARLLLADAELAHGLGPVPATVERVVTVDDPEFAPGVPHAFDGPEYEAFLAVAPDPDLLWRVPAEDDLYAINYTSGTTGRPKGVMYTHRGAHQNALAEIVCHGLGPTSAFLWTLPMFHCNGWCFPWAVTAAGGRHVLLRKVDPPLVWRLVHDEGVTHLNGAPTVLIMLAHDPGAPRDRLARPLRIATGGAPPSPTLLAQWEAIGAELTHLYGLTETYGPHVTCDWQPEWNAFDADTRARLRARQGVAHLLACELRVVDGAMQDVPADATTMGEVVMRGNNVMAGYYADPEATAQAFRGGWFHSGDIGVVHPDGYVELRDRKKDIIISGGENISTIEVEHAIVKHPDVLECAVVSMPDEKWGEVPKAFVHLRPGARLGEPELIAFCRERLAHFKCPKQVEFTELPKTSTGKIQKFKLREMAWKGRSERISGGR